jgi:hypothetical protein
MMATPASMQKTVNRSIIERIPAGSVEKETILLLGIRFCLNWG